ncbi:diaminopimelate epimerase [Spongiactinospora gelatinilytica]|uniref:Diaminopimelate epimerase n=1 Tax=Spongiactinospora gelatinilytica TaxID=2666298 RepID=A0A2W2FM36_9ACTN|nr:diaminopimelate epimerase [Spongiactinospora gelatinilytica]PZG31049.1 diaminopimelate epimerase [Spongiactinospora gelatinilytica]
MPTFDKIHGAGNDFIVVKTSDLAQVPTNWPDLARTLCDRRTGIGADGLVIITAPLAPDRDAIGVTCINPDGTTATMCGNALRCVAWSVARDRGLSTGQIRLDMHGVEHHARVADDGVWVTVEVGKIIPYLFQATLGGRAPIWFASVDTGTEHVVAIVDDVEDIDVPGWGRLVRHRANLEPKGANVGFMQHLGGQELTVRTYERGVEDETLSCGSGAVAAAVTALKRGQVAGGKDVIVHNRSGRPLIVRPRDQRPGRAFWVGGPVTQVYQGVLS